MSASSTPLVTVAMSVRNVEATVARALRSLVLQTHTNWELRLIDDGSTDGTLREVARIADPRINIERHRETAGLATRLNQAVATARGSYIARMDGDDFSYPDRFARQVAFLESHREIDLVGTGAVAFDAGGVAIGAFRTEADHESICRRPDLGFGLAHPTWMGRCDWFRRHPYPATAVRGQDQALLLATHKASRFANVVEPLLGYRQDVPSVASIVGGRWHYSRALVGTAVADGDWPLLVRGVAQQAARSFVTLPLVLSGGHKGILARRFRGLTATELKRFDEVRAVIEG
jgi:glycosyltransferase involved in cell wall biosynthesis